MLPLHDSCIHREPLIAAMVAGMKESLKTSMEPWKECGGLKPSFPISDGLVMRKGIVARSIQAACRLNHSGATLEAMPTELGSNVRRKLHRDGKFAAPCGRQQSIWQGWFSVGVVLIILRS
jgi:hypothetical protein